MSKRYRQIIIGLAGILGVELVLLGSIFAYKANQVSSEYEQKLDMQRLTQAQERKNLIGKLEETKYAATGSDAYERIYNGRQKDVVGLIEKLASESFTQGWRVKVEVEEFTKTLLVLRPEVETLDVKIGDISKRLLPVLQNSRNFLGNVAVYNNKHRCFLFFDEEILKQLKANHVLTESSLEQAKRKGISFTRYNAVTIPFREDHGHIFVPVLVSGHESMMMLDTGASMTVISPSLAIQTGSEDLNKAPRQEFSTAKGTLTCAIIEREVRVGEIGSRQKVAVAFEEGTNLLGVDFFKSQDYRIDSRSRSIYVWPK